MSLATRAPTEFREIHLNQSCQPLLHYGSLSVFCFWSDYSPFLTGGMALWFWEIQLGCAGVDILFKPAGLGIGGAGHFGLEEPDQRFAAVA